MPRIFSKAPISGLEPSGFGRRLPSISVAGAPVAVPTPIRSVDASVMNKLGSVSPSMRKSLSAPVSLNIKVPPSKLTLPLAVNVVPTIARKVPAAADTAPMVVPSIAPAFISTVAKVAVNGVQILEALNVVSSHVRLAEPPKEDPETGEDYPVNESKKKKGNMNCRNCNWSWDIEEDDTDPSLCHKCGYNSELGKILDPISSEHFVS